MLVGAVDVRQYGPVAFCSKIRNCFQTLTAALPCTFQTLSTATFHLSTFMKSLLFTLLLSAFAVAPAFAQPNFNMTQLAHWDDNTLPIASPGWLDLQYSGCWGIAVNGREYAVLGGAMHVLFFDITKPDQPRLIGKFAGKSATVWREFKSYKNRIYAVSDNTDEGLMIFDMHQAPDTVYRTYFSNEFFNSAHTITLDTTSGHIYLNGSNAASQGMIVLGVKNNPDKPELLSVVPTLQCGYIHDSYVRHDTLYASSGNNGYCVYDFSDLTKPKFLAAENTGGYNHNSWLTTDGRYAYYTEEIPEGRPIQVVDLKNLKSGEIKAVKGFLDNLQDPAAVAKKAIAHNVYIRDHLLFNSQYEDGLLVYDISNPFTPVLKAHFDTHPENTEYKGYFGNWGNYPWLPSGTIIAGDMQNGLYILKLDKSVAAYEPAAAVDVLVSPNPAREWLHVQVGTLEAWQWTLLSTTGQQVAHGECATSYARLSLGEVVPGIYFLQLRTASGAAQLKRVVVTK